MANRKAKKPGSPAVEESIVAQMVDQLVEMARASKDFDDNSLLKLGKLEVKGMKKHRLVSEAITFRREQL